MKNKKEILMYIVFGVLTTLVGWGTYALFANACKMNVFWSNLLSWACAVAFAFVTNKLWVFESKSWDKKQVLKEASGFVASRGLTGVIEIVAVPIVAKLGFDNIFYNALNKLEITADILFTNGIYSKVSVAFVIVILNYVFSKLIVFKKRVD